MRTNSIILPTQSEAFLDPSVCTSYLGLLGGPLCKCKKSLILCLGFLNTNESPLSRGEVSNYGLMDQMAVLQWVKENAASFGGDPDSVTLLGHGTGAACIEYLAHSPTTVPGEFTL